MARAFQTLLERFFPLLVAGVGIYVALVIAPIKVEVENQDDKIRELQTDVRELRARLDAISAKS